MNKHIFVTGGVVSGLGKGITASSIATLLKARGLKVFMQKIDPYINVDPGTMSPYQHGEVFVTADGTETDLDLGHYERFIDEELNYSSSITMGKIYKKVIEKERRGDYLGGTVQIVPHVTNEIKNSIFEAHISSNADVVITEVGGTVGDIEGAAVIEALRQIKYELGVENCVFVHTTLLPYLPWNDEIKTKPSQQSIIELRRLGITPDFLVARSPNYMDEDIRKKLSIYCSIPTSHIIDAVDVKNIYEVPLVFEKQEIDTLIIKQLKLKSKKINVTKLRNLVEKINNLDETITIGIVGKYVALHDAYLSVCESIKHAGFKENVNVVVKWINSEELTSSNVAEAFSGVSGVIVPGGFGNRGIEGKLLAIKYAREYKIPFLGICLGMQLATIEFATNVCKIKNANSTEFGKCEPIIDLMEEQKKIKNMGGTMRLGNYECNIVNDTLAHYLYKDNNILERHRHRFEFNNKYKKILEDNGLIISGVNRERDLVEIIELKDHPFFIASQFHPEFKSRPLNPHPLFLGLIKKSKSFK